MMRLQLAPLDTLFFRDGTPFTADSSGPGDVGGLFPPHPDSITGALRAALARCNGWSGSGRWSAALNQALGPGPEDLGLLSFTGPILLRRGEPLYPVPLHLMGSTEGGGWQPRALLQPGPPVCCDLGASIRVPELPAPLEGAESSALKPADGWWLSVSGLEAILQGNLPSPGDLVHAADLWREEARIGIARDPRTRTAQDGMLYTTRHVRLAPDLSIGVEISGLDSSWSAPIGSPLPLGGESRLADCQAWNHPLALSAPLPAVRSSGRLLLVALTPLALSAAEALGQQPLRDVADARVISACLGRPLRIGGWDSLARRPLPLQSFLPAGSVLFCQLPDPAAVDAPGPASGLLRIGSRQRWGYGLAALGTWSDPLA